MSRNTLFSLLILSFILISVPVLQAQTGPVAGEKYSVTFIPPTDSPLASSDELTLIYVFDFWNVRYGTRLALWQNVLRPDTSRVHAAALSKGPGGWSAEIEIPADAALLSYIVKGGQNIVGNNEKTFTSYVYDKSGKPVRNARFFNIPFLRLARAEIGSMVQEAEREITEYPENFSAYHQYFKLLLEQGKGSTKVQSRISSRLDQLEQRYGAMSDFLNMAAETWYYVLQDQEKALEYRSKIVPNEQWPQVFRMFDSDSKEEDLRTRQVQAEQFRSKLVNAEMPAFNLHDKEGSKVAFPNLDGKVRLMVFWASSSENSKQMLGLIRDVVSGFPSRSLEVVAVNLDPEEQKATEFYNREAFPFVLLFNQGSALQLLGVDSIPITYVIDSRGVVRSILVGYAMAHADELRTALGAMLD
ncbi:MAG: TlpA disulfide reductase family protein [Bacteroidota bacterium]